MVAKKNPRKEGRKIGNGGEMDETHQLDSTPASTPSTTPLYTAHPTPLLERRYTMREPRFDTLEYPTGRPSSGVELVI